MKQLLTGIVLATALLGPAAHGADVATVTRTRSVMVEPGRAISRLADQGLGYSVLHDSGVPQRAYRVHVTCAIDESFMQTYCPTPAYVSSCPSARIVCGDGAVQEVRALRLKY